MLVRHAIKALRIIVGAIFLSFGVLKFLPRRQPRQGLSIKTIDLLTFGLIRLGSRDRSRSPRLE